MELLPIFKKAYWTLAAFGLVYVLFVFSLTFPDVQRIALYANKVNPTYFQDVNDVEQFGFLKSQVQPFNLKTHDNETIYAWHILPLNVYQEHEEELLANPPNGPAEDVEETVAFKLLANDPNARVVVSFHGNAAHLGSAHRPTIYRSMLSMSTPEYPVHVFAMDYRGFGLSTGSPTEEGVITDAVTLVNHLISPPLSISPSRIVIMGQSLGSAVSAAVAERFAFGASTPDQLAPAVEEPEAFAGVILVACFSKMQSLIHFYSIKGVTPPMLSPLVGYPKFQKYVLSHIVDTWDTAARVARLTGISFTKDNNSEGRQKHEHKELDLSIIHARDDVEIPASEGKRVWISAVGGPNGSDYGKIVQQLDSESGNTELRVWEKKAGNGGMKRVRWEKVTYGGHNRVATYSAAALAVLRAFQQ